MEGGVKFTLEKRARVAHDGTYKNIKPSLSNRRSLRKQRTLRKLKSQKKTTRKIGKKPALQKNFKAEIEELLGDLHPTEYLHKAARLIRGLLRLSQKGNRNNATNAADQIIVLLASSLFYAFKENNDNSNNNSSNLDEDDIYNDTLNLLKRLSVKIDKLADTDDEEFQMEVSETIKDTLRDVYIMKHTDNAEKKRYNFSEMMNALNE
jgi:hypothetical protein